MRPRSLEGLFAVWERMREMFRGRVARERIRQAFIVAMRERESPRVENGERK